MTNPNVKTTKVGSDEVYTRLMVLQKTRPCFWFQKDADKFRPCNKIISRGSEKSSSHAYQQVLGDLCNCGTYDSLDVVGISAEGKRNGRMLPDFQEIDKAIAAGVIFITDPASGRSRDHNSGERLVAVYLEDHGYNEVNPGVWTNRRKAV